MSKQPTNKFRRILTAVSVVLAIAVIALGALLYARYNQDKPVQTALFSLQAAITQHNSKMFTDYVDIDRITNSTIQQIFPFANQPAHSGHELPHYFLQRALPSLANAAKQDIIFMVEHDTAASSLVQEIKQLLLGHSPQFKGFVNLQKGEKTTAVTAKFFNVETGLNVPLTLVLEQRKNRWTVIDLPNLSENLIAALKARVNTLEQRNQVIIGQMNESLQVLEVQKSVLPEGGNGILLRSAIQNASDRDISEFKLAITFTTGAGETLHQLTITETDPLASGEVLEKSQPIQLANPNLMQTLAADSTLISISPLAITFADGQTLQPLTE